MRTEPHCVGVKPFPEVPDCKNRADVLRALDEALRALLDFLEEVPDDFLTAAAYPEGWTVKKNFYHSARTIRLVSSWVGAPRFLLPLGGKVQLPDMTGPKIIVTNRPPRHDYGTYPKPDRPRAALKADLAAALTESAARLKAALNKRSDEELVRYSAPFWKGNMLTFSIFAFKHALHHINVSRIRLMARNA